MANKAGHVPFFIPGTEQLVQVPEAEVSVAEGEGYVPASPEQESAYYVDKEYSERSPVERQAKGFATGAVSQVLALPAMFANTIPFVDGQSGHQWTAELLASVSPEMDAEEAADRLRLIAKHGSQGHFVGEVGGMILGTKGVGALSKAGVKAMGVAASAGLKTAGMTAESVATHMSLANEQAFVDDREVTTEALMVAAAMGGIGPLGFSKLTSSARRGGQKVANKLDAKRTEAFERAFGDAQALSRDVAGKEATKASKAIARAQKKLDSALMREQGMKARDSVAKTASEPLDDASRAALEARQKDIIRQTNAIHGRKGRKVDQARNELLAESRANIARLRGEAPAGKALTTEQKIYEGARRDKILNDVATAKAELDAARRAARAIGPAPVGPLQAPAKLSDLFSADRSQRLGAMADVLDEGAALSAKSSRAFRGAGNVARRQTERTVRGPSVQHGFGGGLGVSGGLLGGMVSNDLIGAISGGAVGLAVQHFGPRALGWALQQTSNGFRQMASHSAKRALSGARRKVAPIDALKPLFAQGGRALYRTRVKAMLEGVNSEVDRLVANPDSMIESIGDTFGELEEVSPHAVAGVTQQYAKALSYLKGVMPPQPLLHPGMPQLGRRNVPLPQAESYLRRVRAVTNPMAIISDIESGSLHRDTVEAMEAVYPSMMLDLKASILQELSEIDRVPDRKQAMMLDKILGGQGLIYGANNPGFQARLAMVQEAKTAGSQSGSAPKGATSAKPGRNNGSPTLSQQYKTGSQRASDSIGN